MSRKARKKKIKIVKVCLHQISHQFDDIFYKLLNSSIVVWRGFEIFTKIASCYLKLVGCTMEIVFISRFSISLRHLRMRWLLLRLWLWHLV